MARGAGGGAGSAPDHARHMRDMLLDAGVDAAAILGHTPTDERADLVRAFKSGRIQALVNVNVLTTGFNAPAVDLMAVLRPTASPGLHVQMLGRGTRMAPGKTDCLVLDFAGNVMRHGPLADIQPPSEKRAGSRSGGGDGLVICRNCQSYMPSGTTVCADCGHVRERQESQLSHSASDLDPMQHRSWEPVRRVTYQRHLSRNGKPPTLRASYLIPGNRWLSEWVPIESEHQFARIKAQQWWRKRAPGCRVPGTVAQALRIAHQLRVPTEIATTHDGSFLEVTGARFDGTWDKL